MMLYTWKDIERELLLNKGKWQGVISNTEIYTDEVIIHLKDGQKEAFARNILLQIFGEKYDGERIFLDLSGEYLNVSFEINTDEENDSVATPLFRNVLYQKTAYDSELTEKGRAEHIVLPTYRYVEQLLDMYARPESLATSYNKKYILAEVLSKLGEKIGAGLVLIDLRAGLSEFSAPLLFDPRVKNIS